MFPALEHQFGSRVSELVGSVTNPSFDLHEDINQQYCRHLSVALDRNPWARVIKISDFTDNGVGVIHITGDKARRAAAKYCPLIPVLRELIGRQDTPLSPWVKEHIFAQIDLAEQRFSDILSEATTSTWPNPAAQSTV